MPLQCVARNQVAVLKKIRLSQFSGDVGSDRITHAAASQHVHPILRDATRRRERRKVARYVLCTAMARMQQRYPLCATLHRATAVTALTPRAAAVVDERAKMRASSLRIHQRQRGAYFIEHGF